MSSTFCWSSSARRALGLVVLVAAFGSVARAQETPADSVVVAPEANAADAARAAGEIPPRPPWGAARRSLILPGWGQVYNRNYLRAVLAAGAVGGLASLAVVLNDRTVRYRRAAIYADCIETPVDTPQGTCDDALSFEDEWNEVGRPSANVSRSLRDTNRRNRDFSILAGVLAYALQAGDAYVGAELATFDVSEDLSFRVVPTPAGGAASLRWSF